MNKGECRLRQQGFSKGSCAVRIGEKSLPACHATLKTEGNKILRRITSIHLSRPENYLSIYQSGCNFSCRKCHSWTFSKVSDGNWYTPEQIRKIAVDYSKKVTLKEPREMATAWHAHYSCRCCGACRISGTRSHSCPGILNPEAILLSPQGFGPARNIVAFTGGDITCCPKFYTECAKGIKSDTDLWVLIETNGYGLTLKNLKLLESSGVDAFWLDIKAFDNEKHHWLTGCDNNHILELPARILEYGFVLEVLSLYIPRLVEAEELEQIAKLLSAEDPAIPFTLLAFFPEYQMKNFRSPTVREMVDAYTRVKDAGLRHVRLGNLGIFASTEADQEYLAANVDPGDY